MMKYLVTICSKAGGKLVTWRPHEAVLAYRATRMTIESPQLSAARVYSRFQQASSSCSFSAHFS